MSEAITTSGLLRSFYALRFEQNGRNFANQIYLCITPYGWMNVCLEVNFAIIISKGSIDNTSYSLKVMVCARSWQYFTVANDDLFDLRIYAPPGLTWIPAWLSNDIHHKMWDEITYPLPNFNVRTVEYLEWTSNFIPHLTMYLITFPC